jgi:hypothetical protein
MIPIHDKYVIHNFFFSIHQIFFNQQFIYREHWRLVIVCYPAGMSYNSYCNMSTNRENFRMRKLQARR